MAREERIFVRCSTCPAQLGIPCRSHEEANKVSLEAGWGTVKGDDACPSCLEKDRAAFVKGLTPRMISIREARGLDLKRTRYPVQRIDPYDG